MGWLEMFLVVTFLVHPRNVHLRKIPLFSCDTHENAWPTLQVASPNDRMETADDKWAKAHGIDPEMLENWECLDDHLDSLDDMEFSHRHELLDMARVALHGENFTGDVVPSKRKKGEAEAAGKDYDIWPGGKIPYVIDDSLSNLKSKIKRAFKHYHDKTCIQFVPRKKQKDYIFLQRGKGCNSYVGMEGGRQEVNLGKGCGYLGTIVHELGHVLGLIHEHQRPDRDDYLTIYYENIKRGAKAQFKKIHLKNADDLPDFDYQSIMMYGNYAFSINPEKKMTMEAKDGTILKEPFEKKYLDKLDIQTLKNMYSCDDTDS